MNQTEETKLLEQTEEWNDADEFSRCIEAMFESLERSLLVGYTTSQEKKT